MRAHLIGKADDDPAFRTRLMTEPRAVIQDEFGVEVPEGVEVRIHEDNRSAVHLVLPPAPKLDVTELRAASGGVMPCHLCW